MKVKRRTKWAVLLLVVFGSLIFTGCTKNYQIQGKYVDSQTGTYEFDFTNDQVKLSTTKLGQNKRESIGNWILDGKSLEIEFDESRSTFTYNANMDSFSFAGIMTFTKIK